MNHGIGHMLEIQYTYEKINIYIMKNIKTFNEFLTFDINQVANLALNSTPTQITFDGGDGPSAMSDIFLTKQTVDNIKPLNGSNTKNSRKNRRKEIKKINKENKISSMSNNLVSSSNFGDNLQGGTSGGSGSDYSLQGF